MNPGPAYREGRWGMGAYGLSRIVKEPWGLQIPIGKRMPVESLWVYYISGSFSMTSNSRASSGAMISCLKKT